MGSFDSFIDDIEGFFKGNFEVGVERTSKIPVIYIDPKQFTISPTELEFQMDEELKKQLRPQEVQRINRLERQNLNILKRTIEEQAPGFTKSYTDQELTSLLKDSITKGPFAAQADHAGKTFCVVNKPNEFFDEKQEIAAYLSHTPADNLKHVPGTDAIWNRTVGLHEGEHCNQDEKPADIRTPEDTITREAQSDQAAISYLKQNGYTDISQAFIDYRALAGTADVTHATTPFIGKGGDINDVQANPGYTDELRLVKIRMLTNVADTMKIDVLDAEILKTRDPQTFYGVVDQNLKNGLYDKIPDVKAFLQSYVDAYDRRVVKTAPDTAKYDLSSFASDTPTIIPGDTKDKMVINGRSPSEIFNVTANPAITPDVTANPSVTKNQTPNLSQPNAADTRMPRDNSFQP